MCGIVGAISTEPMHVLEDDARVDAAVDALAHRGPDDRGKMVWPDRRGFLGHRRLSIIDLAGGREPITNETDACHLSYNGEIYNFRTLRESLLARGHVFRTQTDGEAALHLYEERPDDFERDLRGMFAIAILDKARQSLTLVRDRNGVKPLYYACDGRRLIFASELKSILLLLDRRPAIEPAALREYLRWKYVPAPLTIYAGVRELPAGHRLHVALGASPTLEPAVRRYWSADFDGEKQQNETEAVEQLDGLLREAVMSHMESDVEVGALLSGGVDSSLVVALAATVSGQRLKTFSVGFNEPGFDQLPAARVLADKYKTDHHELRYDVDPLALLPALVRCFDQPFGDSSALACYGVCAMAAEHVKVALTGDGGDETFAGYRRYADLLAWADADRPMQRAMNRLLFGAGSAILSPEAKPLKRARSAALPPLERYADLELTCTDWLMRRLLTERYAAGHDETHYARSFAHAAKRGLSPLDTVQHADLNGYLPGDILRKVDRTSMAHSLECRVPLLDHHVTEFAATLAPALKSRDGVGKYILKKVAERYVPHELLYAKKRGFRVPIRRWFKGDLLDASAALLRDGTLVADGVLDARGVDWLLRAQRRSWMNLSSLLWSLLFLEHWARGDVASPSPAVVNKSTIVRPAASARRPAGSPTV